MKSSRDGQPKAGTATTAALHGDLDQPKREERPLVSDTETDTKKKRTKGANSSPLEMVENGYLARKNGIYRWRESIYG